MSIMPVKFYGVISYRPNLVQFRTRNGVKLAAGAVALTQRAGAISTEVLLRIVPNMAIVPNNSDNAFCFDMVDFGWKSSCH